MNYRSEREHDEQLICLIKNLDNHGRLDIVERGFGISDCLGELQYATHRRPFDVELTFTNLSIVVESKVDSDEGGRWDNEWQTERIAREASAINYLKARKEYRFITYGTSEFYTKPYKQGPASDCFKHIGLDCMIDMVDSANKVLARCNKREDWLQLMRVEQKKRNKAVELLQFFSNFRDRYLDIHGENDFPNNRFVFCAPELAFPVLGSLARQWNESKHGKKFGKLSLYPVARLSPRVHDSVLNFLEMWYKKKSTINIGNTKVRYYLEINEDFNLNVKFESAADPSRVLNLTKEQKDEVWRMLGQANWPFFVRCNCRDYRQGVLVLYEIDFGLLNGLDNLPRTVDRLANTVEVVVQALSP